MGRAVAPFLRGVLAPLAVGTSLLLNLIGVANVAGGVGGDPWMWFLLEPEPDDEFIDSAF
jgi:hypothetical protein